MARYVDDDATKRLRDEAESRVPPQYSPLPYARADVETRVSQDFAALREAKAAAKSPDDLRAKVAWLSTRGAEWLFQNPVSALSQLEEEARAVVREAMLKEIREGTADLKAARDAAEEAARARVSHPGAAVVSAVAKRQTAVNRRLDTVLTLAAKEDARNRVQEVVRTVDADQAIIFEGERVTREHLDMLRAVGLASPKLDYRKLVSVLLIVGLIVLLLGLHVRHWAPAVYGRTAWLVLLSSLAVASLFTVNLLALALPNVWMLIVPAAALMAAALLADTIAMALALALSLLVGLMANAGLPATLLSLGSAATALAFSTQLWPLSRLRVVIGALAGANLVLVAAVGMMAAQQPAILMREAILAGLYAPGAAVLALGGIYALQRPFGITTHLGLLELLNPQAPLLKRLQAEAPGTYHHSMMVASLSEAAAEAIEADALLTRVGALYHDIGKLYRPTFFAENQALLGLDNVHDHLSSSLSSLIIVSHVKDGVALARKHRLSPEVVDIIEQHHGSTTVSYFYQQALSGSRPEDVSEDQFRYPGPLPGTKEAALVMLADGVHAAAKSIASPTPQRVQQMVKELVRERVLGRRQLERCDLTFGEVTIAEEVMNRVLTASLCRTRIAYPEPVERGVGM
jgi:putative nucleotidyltransferase with HDIG domain